MAIYEGRSPVARQTQASICDHKSHKWGVVDRDMNDVQMYRTYVSFFVKDRSLVAIDGGQSYASELGYRWCNSI